MVRTPYNSPLVQYGYQTYQKKLEQGKRKPFKQIYGEENKMVPKEVNSSSILLL